MSTTLKGIDLRPCPFCGGRMLRGQSRTSDGAHVYQIVCGNCRGRACADTKDEAVAAWNTRTLT